MRKFRGPVFAIILAVTLIGCGGKDEVKKNEGTFVNTPPTKAGAPAAGDGANKSQPPPVPPISD
jgi:hypothetical protein